MRKIASSNKTVLPVPVGAMTTTFSSPLKSSSRTVLCMALNVLNLNILRWGSADPISLSKFTKSSLYDSGRLTNAGDWFRLSSLNGS